MIVLILASCKRQGVINTFQIEDFFPSAAVYNSNSVVIRSRGKQFSIG